MTRLALALALLLAGGCQRVDLPVYFSAPAFTLTDQAGRIVRDTDLRGRVVVADFIYTRCPDVCPTLSARMGALQRQLREAGLLGRKVQLLSVSVDPAHDTPEVLARYAARYGADPAGWRFVTGDPAEVRRVVVDGFKVSMMPVAPPARGAGQAGPATHGEHGHAAVRPAAARLAPPDSVVAHGNYFLVLDHEARVRAIHDGLDLDLPALLRDVRELAR